MSAAPLAGLEVLEFSHTIMGPSAGLVLADLGANVTKVEPAPRGDHTRRLSGFAAGFFGAMNRNKKSLAIDLKHPDGQAAMHKLVQGADVVLENYGPGTMERLGCGYEQLSAINPRLVYLALKGYLHGPYQHRPALDEVVQFHTGLAYMTGPPGRPLRAGASVIDIAGALFGVIAVQAALRERESTGKGQRVSSALFESAAFLMSPHMAGMAATGREPPPMPARQGAWAVYETFDTADESQLFIGVTSDQQWNRFTEEFALSKLAADPRLATNELRIEERSWLIPELKKIIKGYSKADVEARCERANVSWAPVGKPADLFTDQHLLESGGLLDVFISREGGDAGKLTGLPAMPFELGDDNERPGLRSQPPKLGEHNQQVLSRAGFADDAIDDLAQRNIIVSA
ncbi:MAG: crotonobetainyl-CoA:carnitine CoA-transferase CaiB-like acyl-CoA transferase [Gammaproteobacteria bacterium]|jgi:crotonobetainyl-CoA:carnitine CoA-transferase CaiB-like acyl-CoA transferase